jgi:hypothetical protein
MVYHNAMGDHGQERHHFTRCLGIWRLGDVPGSVKSLRSVAKVFFSENGHDGRFARWNVTIKLSVRAVVGDSSFPKLLKPPPELSRGFTILAGQTLEGVLQAHAQNCVAVRLESSFH